MVKKGKKTKKDVGSAAVGAAPSEGADGSGARFALEGMGLGALLIFSANVLHFPEVDVPPRSVFFSDSGHNIKGWY